MFSSWRLGRVFGFPVEVNLSFLLLLGLVFLGFLGAGGLLSVALLVLVFGSVLLHELGHALVARRLGVHVAGIELSFFGGAAKMVQLPRSADHEIAIAAAGPAVSLMLGGIGLGLGLALHVEVLAWLGWVNFVLAGFNLIPALPMDGGRILRALLTRKLDFVRATDVAVQVSRVVAVGFGILGLLGWYQLLVLAPLLWIMGTREQLLARAMGDQFAEYGGRRGGGVGRFHQDPGADRGGSFASGGGRGGGFAPGFERGPAIRQFTIRQVGGRMVIVAVD